VRFAERNITYVKNETEAITLSAITVFVFLLHAPVRRQVMKRNMKWTLVKTMSADATDVQIETIAKFFRRGDAEMFAKAYVNLHGGSILRCQNEVTIVLESS